MSVAQVPASMRLYWLESLERWLPAFTHPPRLVAIFGSGDRPPPEDDHFVCVTSFEMARILYDSLKARNYRCVVVDEAHKLRGSAVVSHSMAASPAHLDAAAAAPMNSSLSNKCSSAAGGSGFCGGAFARQVLDLVKCSRHALLLSGTPSVNRASDLFFLVDALRPPRPVEQAAAVREAELAQWKALEEEAAAVSGADLSRAPCESSEDFQEKSAEAEAAGREWPLPVGVSSASDEASLHSTLFGGMHVREGNVLREEKLQFIGGFPWGF